MGITVGDLVPAIFDMNKKPCDINTCDINTGICEVPPEPQTDTTDCQAPSELTLRELKEKDFDDVIRLWTCSGINWADMAEKQNYLRFLRRNPELCLACEENGAIVGVILCGDDGIYGYIYHVAVRDTHRRQGIGRILVERTLIRLKRNGVYSCRLFVKNSNHLGEQFWSSLGWARRDGVFSMSLSLQQDTPDYFETNHL